jgi:hypothetical protein
MSLFEKGKELTVALHALIRSGKLERLMQREEEKQNA